MGQPEKSSNQVGAFWVNVPKTDKGPVLTGEINGERVVAFKNKRWSEAEAKKQPLYQILLSTYKKKS